EMDYARDITKEYNPNYVRDYEYGEAFRNSNAEVSTLENQSFEEMNNSVFDRTEQMAEKSLSDKQIEQLSPAEREEVIREEINQKKSIKTNYNDRIRHLEE